jgi:hypothetical protein
VTTWFRTRFASAALSAGALAAACGQPASTPPSTTSTDPVPYLDDATYRRADLEASIVNPQNAYSQLRLDHYATGTSTDWDHLPEWNPATEPVAAAELDAPGGAATTTFSSAPSALALPASVASENDPALVALGKEAQYGRQVVTNRPSKSVTLRLLAAHLRGLRDVVVGTIDHPQSRLSDFYRELGDIFGVAFPPHNRFAGFKSLRTRWNEHIATTLMRPVLIIDEAQEVMSSVFNEIRVLTSKDFDSRSLLCVVFAGDGRLTERLRQPDLLPLGSRVRRTPRARARLPR